MPVDTDKIVDTNKVVDYRDLNIYSIIVAKPVFTNKVFESEILYHNEPLILSTPEFKVICFDNSLLEIEFLDSKFYDVVCSLDTYIVDCIERDSKKIFGQSLDYDAVQFIYKKMVQLPLSLDSNPRLVLPVEDLKIIKNSSKISGSLYLGKVKFYKNRFCIDAKFVENKRYYEQTSSSS